ncbi:MAG: DegT/DnrJ/EryC1/StrS aminotransferase [Candidatus Woesebacteria bacterium GW2011_GWB1_39_12]|uniref:DegT/DnrJ/EryC1/StrS aminotransferase n=2 Tax=Candidatus Woeseibacteriota TaxID=1752722 RepID=A0A0G0MAG2_9BACT|nr:MAG: DegT/DnrJ/EryC1/StrS aminotransferase [Candidatus Woesebacteria bacterium GW2011_GWA1_39_12]KKR00413.1 MAG: DegT/DnrJ/EryC1/StrS aminotransferase [Candidatus Woesebacteria bacterium GW2011_GWB1_39_12]
MKRPIAISLSPNSEKDDVILALKLLFSPIQWFNFRKTEDLEKQLSKIFGSDYKAIAVNSGRSALYLILKTLGIGQGDEVCLQALTCVAVPNSILWLKAKPVYIDVDNSFNLEPKDLSEKLSENTRAIIVQHSFGIPADLDKIKKFTQGRKITLIEDCALSLGGKFNNKLLGTIGDVSFFSFGRDKVISSIFGGFILCKDKKLCKKLLEERDKLNYPGARWVIQQLLHPILFSIILPLYNFGLGKTTFGKMMLFLFQKFGLLSKSVYRQEEIGKQPKVFPTKLPGALSILALNQLYKLDKFNNHRKEIANFYFKKLKVPNIKLPNKREGAVWVRFPIISEKAMKIFECLKKNGVLVGDWYKDIVVPVKNLSMVGYERGSCPNAQKLVGKILNLPTYPSLSKKDAEKVVHLIESCLN